MKTKEKLLKEKENILKNIEKRKGRIAQIERELKELENKKWNLKSGEIYHWLDSRGFVLGTTNNYCVIDEERFKVGNYFRTEEEAEFAVERLKVLEELKEFSYEFNDEDWNKPSICKYYIYFGFATYDIIIASNCIKKDGHIYFKTQEDAQKAIDKIGEERLKKYYFKVGNNG